MPARQHQFTITVKGDMSAPDGVTYLKSLEDDPSNKASKFIFQDVDLNSLAVQKLLRENGFQMKSLTLARSFNSERHSHNTFTSSSAMLNFLKNTVPYLTTLIIEELPPGVFESTIMNPSDAIGTPSDLALKRIKITLLRNARNRRIPAQSQYHAPGAALFTELFASCPRLEEVTITPCQYHDRDISERVLKIIESLAMTSRLPQIKKLKIHHAEDSVLRVLRYGMFENRLRFLQLSESIKADPGHVEWILNRQKSSLEYLNVPLNSRHVTLPEMPNLTQLLITKPGTGGRGQEPTARPGWYFPVAARGFLDYAAQFPNLGVLGLKGLIQHYVVDEIFPEGALPCTSVTTLEEMPIGLDRQIMSRVGRLFPNLETIAVLLRYEHEHALISIWERFRNITNLSLALCEDADRYKSREAESRETLDSLFTGIPEAECRRLRGLPDDERERELTSLDVNIWRAGNPSICDLRQLQHLRLTGPSRSNASKLTDIFGYSTLSNLSENFRQFEIDLGLVMISTACVDYICGQLRMKKDSDEVSARLTKIDPDA